jgi:hypothetical protein
MNPNDCLFPGRYFYKPHGRPVVLVADRHNGFRSWWIEDLDGRKLVRPRFWNADTVAETLRFSGYDLQEFYQATWYNPATANFETCGNRYATAEDALVATRALLDAQPDAVLEVDVFTVGGDWLRTIAKLHNIPSTKL